MDVIFDLIKHELARQDAKWGIDRVLDSRTWVTIIGEEFGEVCHASLEHDTDNYLEELVDVAASAIAAIHSLMLEADAETERRNELYKGVYGDLGIAWEQTHDWSRVALMYKDWLSMCNGDVGKGALVERAYADFKAKNDDRTALPTL